MELVSNAAPVGAHDLILENVHLEADALTTLLTTNAPEAQIKQASPGTAFGRRLFGYSPGSAPCQHVKICQEPPTQLVDQSS